MFVVDQWDSPLSLLLEVLLSVAVVAAIMLAARVANRRSSSDHGVVQVAPKQDSDPTKPSD